MFSLVPITLVLAVGALLFIAVVAFINSREEAQEDPGS